MQLPVLEIGDQNGSLDLSKIMELKPIKVDIPGMHITFIRHCSK